MQLELDHPAKKVVAAALLVAATGTYLALASVQFLASWMGNDTDPRNLHRAARLDSGNADYSDRVGRYELLARQSPQNALPWLQAATSLNPHSAAYWIDLAATEQSLGNIGAERSSLERAIAVDPHTPDIAWQVATLYLAQGSPHEAMKQFHAVLENNPSIMPAAIQTLWKIRPDIDYLLENVIPPDADAQFLEFLISSKEAAAAAKVWQNMDKLQQPVQRRYVFEYVQYLLAQKQSQQAALVWQQAGSLSDLAAYQPSPENLIINGDFSLDILNAGFDWRHTPIPGVSLALDPSESHSGSRSLRLKFDGPGFADAGIAQMVPVEPNTRYDFSAFYKAEDMDGAGGLQFALQDAYAASPPFMSEDLRNADFWKKVSGSFITGADTHLLMLGIARVPPDRPIRGKLWIDELQLVPSANPESSGKVRP